MLQALAIPLQIIIQLPVPSGFETRNITFAADTPLPEYTPAILDGWTTFPDSGVAYKYYNHSRTWNLARKDCAARGAHLAVVDSFKKIDYILKTKKSDHHVWVGIHRLFDDVEWVSVKTGLALATIPWAPGETGVNEPSEKCTSLWQDGRGLAPVQCNTSNYFVCEIELQLLQRPLGTVIVN